MSSYELTDFHVGDRVQAFHPHTLGVLHWGDVEKVGRKYLTIRFTVNSGRTHRIAPSDVWDINPATF